MEIKKVGVIGCGVMGAGIAQICAQSKYQVVVKDVDIEKVNKGISSINAFLSKSIEKGKITADDKTAALNRIMPTIDVNNLADCDLIIEAVFEDLELKRKTFAELDTICKKDTIFITNTSALSVIDIAKATNRIDKLAGMHFFNPVPIMKLVEVIKTIATSEETLKTAADFGRSLGKTIVVCKDTPGFIVSRLSMGLAINAIRLVENGVATVEDIDNACILGLNYPMGPLAMADFAGLDILCRGASDMYQRFGDAQYAPPVLLQKMVALGWHGRKTGRGFYEYK
jgi:3-hydroxybutyryl-CoA dehydrogenase